MDAIILLRMWFLITVFFGIIPFSQAAIEVVPEVDRKITKGVEYKTQGGNQILAGTKNGPYIVVWNADIPDDGNYWIFMAYNTETDDSKKIRMKWSTGKSTSTINITQSKDFIKRFAGKLDLKKGKQTIMLTINGKERLNIIEMNLLKDPLDVLEPMDGKIELLPATAYFEGCFKKFDEELFSWAYDETAITWNINIPQEQRYTLSLIYATSRYEKSVSCTVYIGTQKISVKLPATKHFGDYQEQQMVSLTFPAGKYPIKIKKTAGMVNISRAMLIQSGEQEKKTSTLQKKNRLGLVLEEWEAIYGEGKRTDYVLERRGGKEDTDWKIYQGIQNRIESYYWNELGMVITAAFYKGKSVAINVKPEKISPNGAREVARIFLPETTFDWKREDTNYSKDKMFKIQYWGDSFDIKASALLQQLRSTEPVEEGEGESSFSLPKAGDVLLGTTLSQLQQLWGNGETNEEEIRLERQNDRSDKDWSIFLKIKPELTSWRWRYPNKNDLCVTAIFWKSRCIAFSFWSRSYLTQAQVTERVREVAPGVVFASIPRGKEGEYTIYSTNPNNYYKQQRFEEHVELKSPGLVLDIRKQETERLKKSALILIKKLQSVGTPVYGKTVGELDRVLGVSEKVVSNSYRKELAVWDFSQSDLMLQCANTTANGKNLCNEFIIIDKNKSLTATVALAVGRQLIAPNPVRNMLQKELSSWFTITSMDKDKRFVLRWYNDKETGPTLSITDQFVGKHTE